MLYLPPSLGALAKLCARENPRYAVTALRVQECSGERYRVEVTDGRRLAIVRGESATRQYPALADAPDEASEALIPALEWVKAFKALAVKPARQEPLPVGLALGREHFTFANHSQRLTGAPAEGKWPPCQDVLPKKRALVTVRVDARMLAELLTVASAFCPDDSGGVELHFFGKGAPLGLSAQDSAGTFFDGLLVPIG